MATDIRLVSSVETIYLVNTTGIPVAGGSPTAAATTPFMLEMDWTPTMPAQIMTMIGGQPFGIGSQPLYRGYDNVKESFMLTVAASSANNAADLLQRIRRAASTSLLTFPPYLSFKPSGASNIIAFQVYRLDIQEIVYQRSPAEGISLLRAKIEIERHPFGGWAFGQNGETLVNAITLTNTCGSGSSHVTAFAAGSGDLIYEGSPLNIDNTGSSENMSTLWIASIAQREIQGATNVAVSTSDTSSTGTATSTTYTPSITGSASQKPYYNLGPRFRIMARITSATSTLQLRAVVTSTWGRLMYNGSWVTPGTATPTLIDLGSYDMTLPAIEAGNGLVTISIYARSTSGTATCTITAVEVLQYYTFAVLKYATGIVRIFVRSYVQATDGAITRPAVANITPVLFTNTGIGLPWTSAGTPPSYFVGASLWVAWINTSNVQNTAATISNITALHAPQFKTLRGTT